MGTAVIPSESAPVPASSAAAEATPSSAASTSSAVAASSSAAAAVVTGPPAKYEWQLPAKGKDLDPAIVTRTEALARARGLTNEAGQELLNAVVDEVTVQREKRETDLVEAWKPGGTEWKKRDSEWRAAALADPDIGKGSKEKLDSQIELAQKVTRAFGSKDVSDFLVETGLGSHPAVIKLLAKIGKGMSESSLVVGGGTGSVSPQTLAQRMYGPDGTGKKAAGA